MMVSADGMTVYWGARCLFSCLFLGRFTLIVAFRSFALGLMFCGVAIVCFFALLIFFTRLFLGRLIPTVTAGGLGYRWC